MRVLRRAAVLMVLLGLSLGTPGIFAAPSRSQASRPAKVATRSSVHIFNALWGWIGGWMKAGLGSDPLGNSGFSNSSGTKEGAGSDPLGSSGSSNGSQIPGTKEGLGSDPLGRPSSSTPQTQNIDAGCEINPWGQCLPGH
jgi:hypothetical protein